MTWQPQASPDGQVLATALHYAAAHARGGGGGGSCGGGADSDSEGGASWEGATRHPGGPGSILVCELEERCRR